MRQVTQLRRTFDLPEMIDVRDPEVGVDLEVRADGKVVWVNVDGACVLRVTFDRTKPLVVVRGEPDTIILNPEG